MKYVGILCLMLSYTCAIDPQQQTPYNGIHIQQVPDYYQRQPMNGYYPPPYPHHAHYSQNVPYVPYPPAPVHNLRQVPRPPPQKNNLGLLSLLLLGRDKSAKSESSSSSSESTDTDSSDSEPSTPTETESSEDSSSTETTSEDSSTPPEECTGSYSLGASYNGKLQPGAFSASSYAPANLPEWGRLHQPISAIDLTTGWTPKHLTGADWFVVGEYQYLQTGDSEKMGHEEAKEFCSNLGGWLAYRGIKDPILFSQLETQLDKSAMTRVWAERVSETEFKWGDETVLTDTDDVWQTGEPNDTGDNEDCGTLMENGGAYKLNDFVCVGDQKVLCEMPYETGPHYLQIDLGKIYTVKGFSVQGGVSSGLVNDYVESLKVALGETEDNIDIVDEDGHGDDVFTPLGTDPDKITTFEFDKAHQARFVRFYPQEDVPGTLRVEILGCMEY